MSKGTVRFPESVIADGRVGTARIREQIAGAAARLASAGPSPLDTPVARMLQAYDRTAAAGDQVRALSPVERMQQLGRLPRGKKNKTEAAYELDQLAPRLHAGEILWYRFEAIKLRLADNTFITIDYPVINAAGQLEFHEVKGRWTDDARAKTKIAAAQYPFRFFAIQRAGRHGWRVEDLTSRSW
ncbi:hypothetical protein [Paraburkholderia sp. SIMBA_030]|uniref:hypothetical protein n=1 Tax=Paraburkholderia sp. SIMBA_030 TaxID=3085773 RepID=UPI0039782E16